MNTSTVAQPIPAHVRVSNRAEFPQTFELRWNTVIPDEVALAIGNHPDTRTPVLWTFPIRLLARGSLEPSKDTLSGCTAKLDASDPRWLLLASVADQISVLLPVSFVERFLYRVGEAQAESLNWDAEIVKLLDGV